MLQDQCIAMNGVIVDDTFCRIEIDNKSHFVPLSEKSLSIVDKGLISSAIVVGTVLLQLLIAYFGGMDDGVTMESMNALYLLPILVVSFFLVMTFKLTNVEILAVILASTVTIVWEIVIETIGWRYGLWKFMPEETEIGRVMWVACVMGCFFAVATLPYGFTYIGLIKTHKSYTFIIPALFTSIIIGGWASDIFIGGFDSYIITLLVWLAGTSLHFTAVFWVYNKLSKKIRVIDTVQQNDA